jgi:alanyl-tRNA synthetase
MLTYAGALTVAQLSEVEAICREQIAAALPVDAEVVPLKKAMAVQALRAVFGEQVLLPPPSLRLYEYKRMNPDALSLCLCLQYPDPVRVLSVGAKVCEMIASPSDGRWMGASVELCGGTHIANTKEAQVFACVCVCVCV